MYISTPARGSAQWITPATSPSMMSRIEAPVARISSIMSSCRGRSSTHTVMSEGAEPRARGEGLHALARAHLQRDHALGVARAHG